MAKPKIADTKPAGRELEAGTYFWCSCGQSASQPWCDGSHKGTEFSPERIEITERKRFALCVCKHSGQGHLCDGAHKNLTAE